MNRILLLLLIGAITFLLVLYIERPELIQNFWIWAVGFSGVIVRLFTWAKDHLSETTKNLSQTISSKKDAWIKKNEL